MRNFFFKFDRNDIQFVYAKNTSFQCYFIEHYWKYTKTYMKGNKDEEISHLHETWKIWFRRQKAPDNLRIIYSEFKEVVNY